VKCVNVSGNNSVDRTGHAVAETWEDKRDGRVCNPQVKSISLFVWTFRKALDLSNSHIRSEFCSGLLAGKLSFFRLLLLSLLFIFAHERSMP
jgi:hypothetical protein